MSSINSEKTKKKLQSEVSSKLLDTHLTLLVYNISISSMTYTIKKKNVFSLQDICLQRINYLIRTRPINLQGLPLHLIRLILEYAPTTKELESLMNLNADIEGIEEAAEFRWHQLYNDRFWVGRVEPLVLPEGYTWHRFYLETEENQRRSREKVNYNNLLSMQPKEKKPEPTVPRGRPSNQRRDKHYTAHINQQRQNLPKEAKAFFKRIQGRR